ncbi:MAG TPA: hypothetical protein VE974_14675 [Thermoanaerobaculia bacterium]|nr:hypothetical protein [Thermoanaerobaculia bacterium]
MTDVDYLEDELALAEEQQQERTRGFTLSSIFQAIRTHLVPILLTVLAVAIGYFLLAMIYTLLRPVQRNSTLAFRLEFAGADNGQYPNGLAFSGSDIIDTPVLRTVYDANQLGRFMSFSDFSRSTVVLESNAALEALAREYEAKLANPRLTAVERERLEAQFQQKRASLQKNEYALNLATREGVTRIPASVTSKVLYDILRTWADFAASSRQVMVHRVPLVTQQTVGLYATAGDDLLASLLYLRITANELQKNIDALNGLPGAEIIRSNTRKLSLPELELALTHLQRSGIEYLINAASSSGGTERGRAIAVLESQLAYDTRSLATAEDRVRVLRNTLDDYLRKTADTPQPTPDRGTATTTPESIVVTDTFLNNIVSLAQNASDLQYRQRYVDDIRGASLATIPLREAVEYERDLLARIQRGSAAGGTSLTGLRAQHGQVIAQLKQIANDLQEVRGILSRSLTASGQMYTVVSPPVNIAERGVSMFKLGLGGIVVIVVAALLAILAAVLHWQLRNGRQTAAA